MSANREPKKSPLRFAFLGCGAIANKHVTALSYLDGVELVAVSDLNLEAAEAFAGKHGVRSYEDPREMIQENDIDIVSILTPSGFHAKNILDLVDCGTHFVVEKPMALRLDDADKIIRSCAEQNTKVFVVQQNRFNPPVQALKAAIDAGRFGKMVMGSVRVYWCRRQEYYDSKQWRGTWALDGGVTSNQASHHIDMLEWIMGDVVSVMAMTETRLADIEVEDTSCALLRFASGALGVIQATTATRPTDLEGSLTVLGEKASVEIGGFFMNKLKTWQFSEPIADDETIFETHGSNPNIFAWNHAEYLRNVVGAIQSNSMGLVEGLNGRRSLELITAIYESSETGKEVPLRFRPKMARLGLADSERMGL